MTRVIAYLLGASLLVAPVLLVFLWTQEADARLKEAEAAEAEAPKVATASAANAAYCTPELKKILRRVLQSCGLIHGRAGRGCQPMDAKKLATMSGEDFNALFTPMAKRGGIIQFDQGSADLDESDTPLIEKVFAQRGGASYFFVVSRASPEGSVIGNRKLSRQRAEKVLGHLKTKFDDPELDDQVGLLWLGEEYAQLDPRFCTWQRSGETDSCEPEDLNRSAFVTWIDCRL